MFTITSLPVFLSGHHSWWIEHHVHHNDLGSAKDFIVRRRQVLVMTRTRLAIFITRGWLLEKFSWISSPLLHPYSLLLVVTQMIRACRAKRDSAGEPGCETKERMRDGVKIGFAAAQSRADLTVCNWHENTTIERLEFFCAHPEPGNVA